MQHIYPTQTAHVFHLPLVALYEQMHTTQASLSLSAIVPPSAPVANLSEGQNMVAELSFEQGRITRCQLSLQTSERVLLQQGKAWQVLNGVGALPWHIHAHQHDHEAETAPVSAITATSSNTEAPVHVPLQAVPVEQAPLAALPLRVRHVFLLSNGQRTPQDLASVLRLPLDEVERFIQILQKRNLMTWQLRAF
ncbi:hypothetical protein KSC_044510 [Ktedonobacter sp. SOSP1-52]|uniref:hypothetical protein n=1 Tax=Ktedonobacter sp. SOSP1-52 TaxID=2778366 RepID=UPI001915C31C|nr:hypothetical protein [Ktedonobacter sp. SOSP1-52]GHO65559.1 hypothetical protein KSC_044510 [Ktedonobacter sp. SOSP1-52]